MKNGKIINENFSSFNQTTKLFPKINLSNSINALKDNYNNNNNINSYILEFVIGKGGFGKVSL